MLAEWRTSCQPEPQRQPRNQTSRHQIQAAVPGRGVFVTLAPPKRPATRTRERCQIPLQLNPADDTSGFAASNEAAVTMSVEYSPPWPSTEEMIAANADFAIGCHAGCSTAWSKSPYGCICSGSRPAWSSPRRSSTASSLAPYPVRTRRPDASPLLHGCTLLAGRSCPRVRRRLRFQRPQLSPAPIASPNELSQSGRVIDVR